MAKRAYGAAFATGIPEGMFVSAPLGFGAPEPQVCSQSLRLTQSRTYPSTDAAFPRSFLTQLYIDHAWSVAP
jgi:hypothetical protein